MVATKRERLDRILKALSQSAPFRTGAIAREALHRIMTEVEDQLSGIPANPDAATSRADGRMYPPDDRYEIHSGCEQVRAFKQTRHLTSFGTNGAVKIVFSDGTIEVDLPGADGRTVQELMQKSAELIDQVIN